MAGDVAGEGASDDHGGSEAELVAFLADSGDGDSLGAQLAVDARGHLRRLGLVGHGLNGTGRVHTRASNDLPGRTHLSTLGRTHLAGVISSYRTHSRPGLATKPGVRHTSPITEESALNIVDVAPARARICRDTSCQHATSHPSLCECPCGGASHGSAQVASFPATIRRNDMVGGFSRSMLAAIDDTEF